MRTIEYGYGKHNQDDNVTFSDILCWKNVQMEADK